MNNITRNAHAKVNLSLDVLGTRDDGYHEIRMINHNIALHDTLVAEPAKDEICFSCDAPGIPKGDKNLVVKAANALKTACNVKSGAHLFLKKSIPNQAGLGGGSSDAAATLHALNTLWDLRLSEEALIDIGKTIGADVPYCIVGKTAMVTGYGEIITPLPPMPHLFVLVVKPEVNISTEWAFKVIDDAVVNYRPDLKTVIRTLEVEDYIGMQSAMGNVFEAVMVDIYPVIGKIKRRLLEYGAIAAIMTGTGSTVIGYFNCKIRAQAACHELKEAHNTCFLSETC